MKPETKSAISCFLKGGIILFVIIAIVIIIAVVLSIYFIQRFRNNISQGYKMSIVQYCKGLPPIAYTEAVSKPKVAGIYEYSLAKALLETSLFVTQSNCFNIIPIPNPTGFTNQYRLIGKDPADNKNRMFATIFTNFNNNSNAEEKNTQVEQNNQVERKAEEGIIINASGVTQVESNTQMEEGMKPKTKTPNRFLIAFTGTFTLNEWRNDFTYPLVEATALNNYKSGIQAHKGFYGVYLAVRDQIWKIYNDNKNNIDELYITGHSLGGALSTLCAFDFANNNPTHYSFAAPRSGNVAYSNTFNAMLPTSLRIYNTEDIVHSVPPAEFLGGYVYQHTNYGIPFDINLGSIGANHITSYVDYLPTCVNNKAPCS